MDFNLEPTKQAQEIVFSGEAKEISHPPKVFNNAGNSVSSSQKHLGVILFTKVIFD